MRDLELNVENVRRRVLVVDDEPDIGLLMRMMLESAGYFVEHVQNLSNAKKALSLTHFDTVFLDLNLNGEYGLNLVPSIRAQSKDTLIAVITAQKEPKVREEVLASGVNILIEKPFNRKKILEVLK
jgi:DNA-binding response OmpR family regulator